MFFSALTTKIRYGLPRIKPSKKLAVTFKDWKIVKGDTVKIRTGLSKGKVGTVIKVYRKSNRILVAGVNLKTIKKRNESGQFDEQRKEFPIHVSNAGLYDSVAEKAVRIKYGYHPETYEKLRISKKTGTIIPKPNRDEMKREVRGRNKKVGIKDTTTEIAHKITYTGEDFEQIKKQFDDFIAEKERRQRNLVF